MKRSTLSLGLVFLVSLIASGQEWLPCPTCGRQNPELPPARQVDTLYDSSSVSRAFQLANEKRARAGLGPLAYDPGMTQGAQIKVERAARLGIKGHQGGSFYGANKEGVGWSTQEEPAACYLMTAPAGTPAGVAMARGRAGWHTVLLIHYDGYLPSGRTGGPRQLVQRIRRRGPTERAPRRGFFSRFRRR